MSKLRDRVFRLMQDPRVGKLMRDPRVQEVALKAFRFRSRMEGEFDQRVQRIAGTLNLATQRDLRSLQRTIRHLERELREAEERLTASEDTRQTPAHN
jgi:polyhydroxyalkanoate synthesis regulator phasin